LDQLEAWPFTLEGKQPRYWKQGFFRLMSFSKWISAVVGIIFLASPAIAADGIAAGKIKSIDADKKAFVVTDAAGRDNTFKLGDNVMINRGGKESKNNLNAGDPVNICYDKGVLNWTANYILVQEGDSKNCALMHGTFKGYDDDKSSSRLRTRMARTRPLP
jgi:hypothetical protein